MKFQLITRKLLMMAGIAACLALFSTRRVQAAERGDPSEVFLTIYEIRISTSDDCSNPITIFSDSSPSAQDILLGPTLGSGSIPNGAYRCMMVRMSDQISAKPAFSSDSGNCVAKDTQINLDIFRGEISIDPDGNSTTTSVGEDIIWLYFKVNADTGAPGCSDPKNSECQMATALTVTKDADVTFVADFTNMVWDQKPTEGFDNCELDAPTMSFR